jgi:pimeloyl-ACP methyl ester carboxylesterase
MSLNDIPLSQRAILQAEANITNLLYTDPPAAVTAAIALLGPGAVATLQGDPSSNIAPVSLIVTNGHVTLVFLAGSTNDLQLAVQGMFSLTAPTATAGFGTNATWQIAANVIDQRIQDAGISADSPIRFIGHSYGAAVATIVAAEYKRYKPGRPVETTTFGMPKPGDARLIALLQPIPSVNIVAANDPVPSLPPSLPWLLPFFSTVEASILYNWALYENPPNQFFLDDEGGLTPTSDATFSTVQLAEFIGQAILSGAPPAVPAHDMSNYWTKILLP